VRDFEALREIVQHSLATLKQLGSSQYSAAMRPQLLDWYRTVTEAREAVDAVASAQKKWLRQEAILSSMALEDNVPLTYNLFTEIRLIKLIFKVHLKHKTLTKFTGKQ